jgi:hypothetical protein
MLSTLAPTRVNIAPVRGLQQTTGITPTSHNQRPSTLYPHPDAPIDLACLYCRLRPDSAGSAPSRPCLDFDPSKNVLSHSSTSSSSSMQRSTPVWSCDERIFFRPANRVVHDPAATRDAEADFSTDCRTRITEDVCPSCGLVTSRSKVCCLECGKSLKLAAVGLEGDLRRCLRIFQVACRTCGTSTGAGVGLLFGPCPAAKGLGAHSGKRSATREQSSKTGLLRACSRNR